MARILPNKPAGSINSETAKVLHALKRIPGEDLLVWIALPLGATWRPALMAVNRRESCHLIAVSTLAEADAEAVVHGDLFSNPGKVLAASEVERETRNRLHEFRQSVITATNEEYAGNHLPLVSVVAFPNVSQALLDAIAREGSIEDCQLWGRETIRTDSLVRRLEFAAIGKAMLPETILDALREKFTPEIGIPESLVARVQEKPNRNVGPKLTGFLLDIDQEYLAKEDLVLSSEADAALREMRLRLVTGVAGSGKSLILLYRAMLQARLNPDARMLILTHNRPLNGELRERFRRLCPSSGAQWETFYQWCRGIAGAQWDIVKPWERETILRDLASTDPALSRLALNFLSDEIDWIRDQGLCSRTDYLAANRVGRKRPLQDEHRCSIFTLLEKYSAELRRRRMEDWPGAAAAVWDQVRLGRIKPPLYDFVFIDEAQFFAPTWFHIVKRCVRPETGQLFLAADPTQGFLKRRQSWAVGGLDVRGHSSRLQRCYRNTREILQFAAAFYRRRIPEDEEEINLPERAEIELLTSGEVPRLIPVDSSQGERSRVANEIAAALKEGAVPEHFLVLHSESALVAPFIETLNRVAGKSIARDLKENSYSSSGVKVSSLNAATGLESPVVFLCGLDALLEKEGAIGLGGDEKNELVRDNTRRIYMGMTRASQKLIVTYCRQKTRDCLEGLNEMWEEPRGTISAIEPLEVAEYGTPFRVMGGLHCSPPQGLRFVKWAPVYDLEAAAGTWGPGVAPQEIGWKEIQGQRLRAGMFIAWVKGRSMEPKIRSGSWCLFRQSPAGSRNGRTLLVQLNTISDPDCGGRYTVKKWHSEKTVSEDGWIHERVRLIPLNKEYQPIEISENEAREMTVVGEFVSVVD